MARKEALSKNVEVLGYLDLDRPWFQMAMQQVDDRYYIYASHFQTSGWAIVDVTDPTKPEYLKFVPGPDLAGQSTPKIQVADGLMITALGGTLPMLHGTERGDPYEEGVIIWDVSDPVDPKMLSQWSTEAGGGGGVHRFFYSGGRYVHLSAVVQGLPGLHLPHPRYRRSAEPCGSGTLVDAGAVGRGLRGAEGCPGGDRSYIFSIAPSCTVPPIQRAIWPT